MRFLGNLLRVLIGLPLVAVGILVAIISVGGFLSGQTFYAEGLLLAGLLLAALGMALLRSKRRRAASSFPVEEGNWRDDPATDPRNIKKGALPDLTTKKSGR
jgi:hypothetical protein